MKNIYLILSFLITTALFAQVGVGTTNPQQVLHIDASMNNDSSTQNIYEDDVVVTAEGKLGVGTINPITKVDLRSKTLTDNVIAIGPTTQTATQAKEGALQYNGNLKLSDGTNWINLPGKSLNALVYANNSSNQSLANNTQVLIKSWTKQEDVTNSLDAVTGIFTAPKDGVYVVSFNAALSFADIPNNSYIEIHLKSNASQGVPEYRCLNSYPGFSTGNATNISSINCTGIFYLKKNETLSPNIFHTFGGSRNLINDASYNTLTIYGL
ncbi:hypothetical protein HX096_13335 [Empedobacter falsenii]|uniref:hypothetical protein n=1 Tax=Empedobacter falsenii TaxID=343874 RepID=UPI0025765B93|nr:hypothetical protein [Empedobacter falsenii]MDM1548835.1 hypothetical protein [Empedobacter falsenii]